MFFIHWAVIVKMSEEPVCVVQLPIHHLQKIAEGVRLVLPAHGQDDVGRGAVGNYIVCFPACPFQGFQGGEIFRIGRHFFRPPRLAQNPKPVSASAFQFFPLGLKIWLCRVQDAILNIVAPGSSHGEEGASADLIELPTH